MSALSDTVSFFTLQEQRELMPVKCVEQAECTEIRDSDSVPYRRQWRGFGDSDR